MVLATLSSIFILFASTFIKRVSFKLYATIAAVVVLFLLSYFGAVGCFTLSTISLCGLILLVGTWCTAAFGCWAKYRGAVTTKLALLYGGQLGALIVMYTAMCSGDIKPLNDNAGDPNVISALIGTGLVFLSVLLPVIIKGPEWNRAKRILNYNLRSTVDDKQPEEEEELSLSNPMKKSMRNLLNAKDLTVSKVQQLLEEQKKKKPHFLCNMMLKMVFSLQ